MTKGDVHGEGGGVHAWGACVVKGGGMHGKGGYVWQRGDSVHGKGGHVWGRGVCMTMGVCVVFTPPPTRYC